MTNLPYETLIRSYVSEQLDDANRLLKLAARLAHDSMAAKAVREEADRIGDEVERVLAAAQRFAPSGAQLRATEPAVPMRFSVLEGRCGYCLMSRGFCDAIGGCVESRVAKARRAEPAEVVVRHGSGGRPWGYHEPSTPAEPAEEETKAERWTVSTTYRAEGPSETSDDKARIDRFADAWRASGYEVTVSPVVPAPTETGPWSSIEKVPTGVVAIGTNGVRVTGCPCEEGVHGSTNRFAPFVAAEEG